MIGRRVFVKDGAMSVVGLSMVPGFLRRASFSASLRSGNKKTLVVVFQRGGADGLNIVVPFGEKSYYDYRPSIAIQPPGQGEASALDLDGFFGLHPALQPLMPIYEKGDLGIVHAVGSPDTGNRSHFQAQDIMESAAPNRGSGTGWINRHFTASPDDDATAFRGTGLGRVLPKALRGPAPAVAMGNIEQFSMGEGSIYETLYDEDSNSLLTSASRDMFDAIDLLKEANPAQYTPAPGIRYGVNPNNNNPSPFGMALMQVAQLIKADIGLEVAFVDVEGWDHHSNEGSIDGRMMQGLQPFGQALAAFYEDLGDRMEDVVVLTMSEFGRTARENGNRGTDHGHANVMFAMGGPVQGGKVFGDWPGLAGEQLNENRDLALTTDFRDVFAELLDRHLGATNVDAVFPRFTPDPERYKGLI